MPKKVKSNLDYEEITQEEAMDAVFAGLVQTQLQMMAQQGIQLMSPDQYIGQTTLGMCNVASIFAEQLSAKGCFNTGNWLF